MTETILSEAARTARNEYTREWRRKNPDKVRQYNAASKESNRIYYKSWRKKNPDKVKRYYLTKWENRAKKFYGSAYIPPERDDVLSEQAQTLRREYFRNYRKMHREAHKQAQIKYWNNKAQKENINHEED